MSQLVIVSTVAILIVFGHGPSEEIGWNKPGVSEDEFRADLDACIDIFDEVKDGLPRRSYVGGRGFNGMDRMSGSYTVDEGSAVEAYIECFESRGYDQAELTFRDRTRLSAPQYGTISYNRWARALYQIAVRERDDLQENSE